MKIKYLGTAAAEGIPALFCECDYCNKVRQIRGKNIRSRSQTIINDDLMIDFGPDTYYHTLKYELSISNFKNLLITHAHSDHLYPEDLVMRYEPYAHLDNDTTLNIYATDRSVEKMFNHIANRCEYERKNNKTARIAVNKIIPYKSFDVDGKYTVTALEANHKQHTSPVVFIITDGIKIILYAHDTGYFTQTAWDYIIQNHIRFDMVSLDCTSMNTFCDNETLENHMNIPTIYNVCKKLSENGNIDNDTVKVVNHFSHNGLMTHEELCDMLEPNGFIVSYDGLEINF